MAYAITREVQGEEDSKEILFIVNDDNGVSNIIQELKKETEKAYHNSERFIFRKEYVALYDNVEEAMKEINHYV